MFLVPTELSEFRYPPGESEPSGYYRAIALIV